MGQPDPVLVLWEDSHRPTSTWLPDNQIDHTPARCLGVGLLVQWDEDGITLAMHQCEGQLGSTFFIPAGAVTSVEYLRKGKPATRPILAPKDGRSAGAAD